MAEGMYVIYVTIGWSGLRLYGRKLRKLFKVPESLLVTAIGNLKRPAQGRF